MNIIITIMENLVKGLYKKFDMAEERIIKFKDRSIKNTQSKEHKAKE